MFSALLSHHSFWLTSLLVLAFSMPSDAEVIDFREGSNGYAGTVDTWFSALPSEQAGFPGDSELRTALSPAQSNKQSLIRFDSIVGPTRIPQGAFIRSAQLELWMTGGNQGGEPNEIFKMLVGWDENAGYGDPAWAGGATEGVDADGNEAVATPLDSSLRFTDGTRIQPGSQLSLVVTEAVQDWSDAPATNHGFMLQSIEGSPGLGLDDGNDLRFFSSERSGVSGRPRLFVDFCIEDVDGLSRTQEVTFGTDPCDADTDGDGLSDDAELSLHFTNPLLSDTDGDGLADGDEVNTYGTDATIEDTDGDGLHDAQEVLVYKTDPLVIDTDADGLIDGAEVSVHRTNPLLTDTDSDGLTDGEEVNLYGSSPLVVDTDGDTLSDSEEISIYQSDPTNIDTDGDQIADGVEVANAGDPSNPLNSGPRLALSPDVSVELGLSSALVSDEVLSDLGGAPTSSVGLLGVDVGISAYTEADNGDVLFSVESWTLLEGGVAAHPGDVIRYDGNVYSVDLSARGEGVPSGASIDALAIDQSGGLLLSFDTSVLIGSSFAADEDVLSWGPSGFAVALDGSEEGIPASLDVDGLHLLNPGVFLVSFDISGNVGGVQFDDEDLLHFNGSTWSIYRDLSAIDERWKQADLDAVYVPEAGLAKLVAGAVWLLAYLAARRSVPAELRD